MAIPSLQLSKRFIIGCGNTLLGDDGFGPSVVEYLLKHCRIPSNVTCVDLGTSLRGFLFDILLCEEKPHQIILVDAVDLPGKAAGEMFEIMVEDLSPVKLTDFAPHQFPKFNMLKEVSDHTEIDIRILAVQIEELPEQAKTGLSRALTQAIPHACRRIMEMVDGGSR